MIIYLLLQGFDSLLFFVVSMIPTLEQPLWLTTTMPQILRVIYGFNIYLPVAEAFQCVYVGCGQRMIGDLYVFLDFFCYIYDF